MIDYVPRTVSPLSVMREGPPARWLVTVIGIGTGACSVASSSMKLPSLNGQMTVAAAQDCPLTSHGTLLAPLLHGQSRFNGCHSSACRIGSHGCHGGQGGHGGHES